MYMVKPADLSKLSINCIFEKEFMKRKSGSSILSRVGGLGSAGPLENVLNFFILKYN